MATPGWYPDPAGSPGAFRYWDGASWGSDLTDNPYGTPPGAPTAPPPTAAPQTPAYGFTPTYGAAPPSYGGSVPDWSQQASTPGSGNSGRTVLIALVAIVAVVALGVGTFFIVESLTDDTGSKASQGDSPRPTRSASDPTSDATSDPSGDPTDDPTSDSTSDPTDDPTGPVVPTDQQCTGGQPLEGSLAEKGGNYRGGGLKLEAVPGYSSDLNQAAAFTFADGAFAPSKIIEQNEAAQTSWVSVYMLGGLPKANGFDDPQQAAEVVLACMAADPSFYTDFSGRTDLDSAAVTVDGREAWQVDAELRIDSPDLKVEGDVAKVIVVDTGDPDTFGLFVSVVPIGDQTLINQQDLLAQSLQVR